jgi:hypothetical protein
MYMEDLSTYRYHLCEGLEGVLPVGWLSAEHPFDKGIVSSDCVSKLTRLAVFKSTNFMRGVHRCEFCGKDDIVAEFNGIVRSLGTAEIWIPGEGVLYAAPNLILHYVMAHQYRPPESYIRALEALDFSSWAPPQDYVRTHRSKRST